MKISTRIIIGYALVLLIFSIVTFVNYRLAERVNENSEWLSKSELIIRTSAQLQRGIIDMENSFRGYLLTGKDSFLEPYFIAEKEVPALIQELRDLIDNEENQLQRLRLIDSLYKEWHVNFSTDIIASKRESLSTDLNADRYLLYLENVLKKGAGKLITDRIRLTFRHLNEYEYNRRQFRRETLNRSVKRTSQISLLLIAVSFLIGILSAAYVVRTISRRIREMVDLAGNIAQGNFKAEISDTSADELTDLSQSLGTMAHTLDETFTDLARKNADLNQFAYIVSHDLKAPLRGIENVLAWIKDDLGDKIDPQLEQYHQLILGRVKRMENLINGILDFSRVGRTKKPVERVDVSELLKESIENISPPKTFRIKVQPGMPVLVTERIYLQQVFTNLISNAVKYHDRPDGRIEIGFTEDENFYTFFVKDDGPGIEPDYHERIFVMFQTLKERDAFESTGVGLTIVKKIIEEKGGKVWVESEPGKGSTFYFTWPKFGEAI